MTLTYRNGVSIGELVVYTWAIAVAIFLVMRHGFRRNAGWIYLVLFCLARIIGPAMQLATISHPNSTSLYTGYSILNNVGLSPLMLAAMGLLGRLLDSIHETHRTRLHPVILQTVQLIIMLGLILGIVGGINASDDYTKALQAGIATGYSPGSLSKAGTSLFVIAYVAIVAFTITISFSTPHAQAGEHRLLYAVAAALPFLLIRLLYSCISTFSHHAKFNLLTGDETVLLFMAYLMEIFVVLSFEITGLTLRKAVDVKRPTAARQIDSSDTSEPFQKKLKGNMALNIAKKTILGKIVLAFIPRDRYRDAASGEVYREVTRALVEK